MKNWLVITMAFLLTAAQMTVQAAALAGLTRVILIEEPQAAFYAWVYKHQDHWESLVAPGQKILVCDVGGGTSDFTLIRVRRADHDAESSANARGSLCSRPPADLKPQTSQRQMVS